MKPGPRPLRTDLQATVASGPRDRKPPRTARIDIDHDPTPETPDARYEVRDEIGRGGIGVILRVWDKDVRRDVAMKVLQRDVQPGSPEFVRFIAEGQITGQLEHPNIVPVHEVGDGSPAWFTMKLVNGESLRQRLRQLRDDVLAGDGDRRFPLMQRLAVFRRVCDAIAFAHGRGVIHRDLKPDNVMVGEFGEVQVMDWGLARVLDDKPAPATAHRQRPTSASAPSRVTTRLDDDNRDPTLDGDITGTPAYMPPEQANGEHHRVDQRSDIWSLGAILHEILVLAPPYAGQTVVAVLAKASEGKVQRLGARARKELGKHAPAIPRELEAIALRCMEPEPRRRYQDVSQLARDIDAFIANEPVSAWRDTLLQRLGKWGRRHPTAATVAVLVTLFVAIAGGTGGVVVARLATQERELAERAQHTAELERAADLERQKHREAEMLALVQQGELDKLREAFGLEIRETRDRLIDTIRRARDTFMQPGMDESAAIRKLGKPAIREWIGAFEQLAAQSRTVGGESVSPRDYYFLALLLALGEHDYERSLAYFDESIRLQPDDAGAYLNRGNVHSALGHNELAVADYTKAIELAPDDPMAYGNRGTQLYMMENPTAALRDLDRALLMRPDSVDWLTSRGLVWQALDKWDRSLDDLRRAADLAPTSSMAQYHLGNVFFRTNRLAESEPYFSAAIRLDATNGLAHLQRGIVRNAAGDKAGALADQTSATELLPDEVGGWVNRAGLWTERQEWAKAVADMEVAVRLAPREWTYRAMLAERRKLAGNPVGALADFRVALELCPDAAGQQKLRQAIAGLER
ncbi:MAG: tetratricopeptide repeat protein [Planctomycetota bacterium]